MARIQASAPVAATKAPPAPVKASAPPNKGAPDLQKAAWGGKAPGKAPAPPGKAPAPVASVATAPAIAYATKEDFDLLKAMLGGMQEAIAKLHKGVASTAPGKGGKLGPRAIAGLLDCPNTGDWRDAWQDAARAGMRLETHHFRTKDGEIEKIDREASPKIPMLLCIPRDSEPEGALARAQGLIAAYSAFSEDGENVIGPPGAYLSEEEIGQIRAD